MKRFFIYLRNKLFLNAIRGIVRAEITNGTQELQHLICQVQNIAKENRDFINKNYARLDDIYYNSQVLAQVPVVHKYFSQFKRIHEGQDVVLLASGPSLSLYSPIPNAVHVGVNGVFRSFENLDYLFLTDYALLDPKLNEEIDVFRPESCKKFYCILPQRRLQVLNQFTHFTERIPQTNFIKANAYPVLLEDIWYGKFGVDLESEALGDFGGSVFSALQFIMYTHPKRVFLVGQDCTTGYVYKTEIDKDKLPNHATKISGFNSFKNWADKIYPDIEIISVNPVGLKGIFKDWYQAEGEELDGRQNA